MDVKIGAPFQMGACYQPMQVIKTKACPLGCILGNNSKWNFYRVISACHTCWLAI